MALKSGKMKKAKRKNEKNTCTRPVPKGAELSRFPVPKRAADQAPFPSGVMKRGVCANPKSAPSSAPPGMDGGQPPDGLHGGPAHRGHTPAAGGQPRGIKRKADYFETLLSTERVIPECWEDDVLPDALENEGPDTLRTSETTNEVAPDPIDGAVAAGQSGAAPPDDMGVDNPPEAPQRLLRIKKKQKPGFVPPASASAAPADGGARAPAPPVAAKHAWQHADLVRKDLSEMFRPRSTEQELGSIRAYSAPTDSAATPAGPDTQRGSTTQRG